MSLYNRFFSVLNKPVVKYGAGSLLVAAGANKLYQNNVQEKAYLDEQKELGFKRVKVGERVTKTWMCVLGNPIPSKTYSPVYELQNETTGERKAYELKNVKNKQGNTEFNNSEAPNEKPSSRRPFYLPHR